MTLDPHECVDSGLLFMPHLFDHLEVSYLYENLGQGDIFVDVGSNIGFYSLVAAAIVGRTGSVVAIEAVPSTYALLKANIDANHFDNILAINVGVSSKNETMSMTISSGQSLRNNRGGNSFLSRKDGDVVEIPCRPLSELLPSIGINRIDGMKLDVEGFEFRILSDFLRRSSDSLPRFIILEQNPGIERAEGDAVALLQEYEYHVVSKTRHDNYIMRKR